MAESVDCDVLIAGAGPTGMSAALALHDAGYKVQIIDKHKSGLSFSRAILVNSGTLRLLKPYGVADKIMMQGTRHHIPHDQWARRRDHFGRSDRG